MNEVLTGISLIFTAIGLILAFVSFNKSSKATKLQALQTLLLTLYDIKQHDIFPLMKGRNFQNTNDFKRAISTYLNHLEILAFYYNHNKFDRDVCQEVFGLELMGTYENKLIKKRFDEIRAENTTYYCEIQKMYDTLNFKKKADLVQETIIADHTFEGTLRNISGLMIFVSIIGVIAYQSHIDSGLKTIFQFSFAILLTSIISYILFREEIDEDNLLSKSSFKMFMGLGFLTMLFGVIYFGLVFDENTSVKIDPTLWNNPIVHVCVMLLLNVNIILSGCLYFYLKKTHPITKIMIPLISLGFGYVSISLFKGNVLSFVLMFCVIFNMLNGLAKHHIKFSK